MEQLDPKKTLDAKRFMDYESSVKNSKIIKYVLNFINKENRKIIDVGGASGIFLNEILKNSKYPIQVFNMEIDDYYKNKLVNKKINLIRSSILENNINSKTFDIVVFRHILHHLVSDNVKETRKNQDLALKEMFRILKSNGYLVFEEQVNNIKIFSRVVYYLSKWANKFKIKSRTFEAGKVIVSFMTPEEIEEAIAKCKSNGKLEIIDKIYNHWDMGWKWKFTFFMGNVGSLIYVVKKID